MALKILILTPRIPFPLRDGGAIAMNQTIEQYLEQECEVSLLAMNTSRHWVDDTTLPEFYKNLKVFESIYVKTNINPLAAFFNLFTDKSYNVERFVNKEFQQKLIEILATNNFDFVQFESIYTSPYLKIVQEHSNAKCVCRVHNIEYLIWQGLSNNENSFLKKKYLKLLTKRLEIYELNILKQFDLLLPISKIEEKYFNDEKINQCYYLPFGVESKIDLPEIETQELSCFHIGSMDWMPNIEGVRWLIDEVWIPFRKQFSEINLYLAGKNMPATLVSNNTENIHVVGEVDDMINFSLEKNIMLVPLQSGAGIRIKILQAMALEKIVITTSVGAEGINVVNYEQMIIADSPRDFANAIEFCFSNLSEAKMIGSNAKRFVLEHFDKLKIYQKWLNSYSNYL